MNTKTTITKIVHDGLCTGCGTCAALCPGDAIILNIEPRKGIYVPVLDDRKCNACGICVSVCPGGAVDFKNLNESIFGKQPDDAVLGNYLQTYVGHATDRDIRFNSASGGLVTALLIYALESGMIDGALVTGMQADKPLESRPFIARTRAEIIAAAGSKYCPVPANTALKEILQSPGRFAVVGLPCHIEGIRKAEAVNKKLKDKIALRFGILCAHTDNFIMTRYILKQREKKIEDLVKIQYRGGGWPGGISFQFKQGTPLSIAFHDYIGLHSQRFFMPQRCLVCADSPAKLADVTFMDGWLPELIANDKIGTSIIIARTAAGADLCKNAATAKIADLSDISRDLVVKSQGTSRMANRDMQAVFFFYRLIRRRRPEYGLSFPKSGAVNYLRSAVTFLNMWLGSNRASRKLIKPVLLIESRWKGKR